MKKVGTAHYNPRLLKIVSQFKLNEQPGEFIATHVTGLCKWSKFCEYDESLDGMLCDRLVCGLADNGFSSASLQRKVVPLASPRR